MVLSDVFYLCLASGDGGKRFAGIGRFRLGGRFDDDWTAIVSDEWMLEGPATDGCARDLDNGLRRVCTWESAASKLVLSRRKVSWNSVMLGVLDIALSVASMHKPCIHGRRTLMVCSILFWT